MPLFEINKQTIKQIGQSNFKKEKTLQTLVEKNLDVIFNCRFVHTEFPTGVIHSGRIDTLALSEENNPVIIEYKKKESSELINQSLYYLSWIYDHKGDYEVAVQKSLGNSVKIDWSDVRVICIAPYYKKFDLHAVQVMGANIELWTYRLFNNSTLYLEEVLYKSYQSGTVLNKNSKNPIMVEAGKKAAITRKTSTYTFEEHLNNKSQKIKELAISIQEFITGLDASIEENPRKHYIAYKTSQNIVCMEIKAKKIDLYLKLNPKILKKLPKITRDVSHIGHFGTGDLQITISNIDDLEIAKPLIEMAYQNVGG